MAGNHNQAVDDFGYQYKYDDKNRCIASKLPGADWTYHIYDRHDRLTFTQDGNLRMTGKWRMTLYDALGRQTFTGIYNGDASSLGIEDIDAATESAGTGGFFGYTLPAQIATSLVTPHVISYYDRYDTYLGNIAATAPSYLGFITRSGYDTSCDGRANGLMTGKLVFREDGSGSIPQIFFYDAKGRLIQTRNSMGHTLMNAYDFIGNNTRTYEAVTSGSETYWIETVRTFKHNGLIEDVIVTTNGNAQAQFTYTYDNLNRLTQVEYGDIVETYNYNLRGWSTGKTVTADGERLFSMSARYESPVNSQSQPQFGGNISEWQWGRGNLADKIYSFAYDALSRIISGTLTGNVAGNDTFAEKDITYDRNGNILTLKRFGENGIIADIVNILTGNRIASNTYDDCGNVTYDSASGTTLEWNSIGLIKKVSAIDGTLVNYSYLADGTKISALDDQGNGLEYRGSLTFRRNGSSLQIEGIDFPGGRFVAQENGTGGITLVPHYHITDHLGSVRAVVDGSTGQVIETNDYYPFGKRWDSSSSVTSPDNRFRFNGKEDQSEFGSSLSDYGARQYSASTGRWLAMDPLAEKYYPVSPYAFCNNNPVNLVDLDGRDWYSYIERSEDESQNDYVTKYAWTDATSQEELDAIGGKGTYLGQAVIIFDGAIDERLDENGKLTGEGAKPATITIYGINGADDIASYLGLSVSSDPSKYSMIQDGEYRLFHQQMATSVYGKESLTYRISDINGNLKINPVGGVNKYNGSTYMEGLFLHRTDKDGTARKSSQGCLVVDGRSWRDVEKQLGKSSNIYLKLSRQ